LNETRHVIFNALIEINDKINPFNPIDRNRLKEINEDYQDIGISSKDLTLYLSNRHQPLIRKELKKIKEDYIKKKIDQDERNFLINKLNSKYHIYSERTVQRALKYFKEQGVVKVNNGKYALAHAYLNTIRLSPGYFGEKTLMSIMKLHTPLYNDLEKNIKELVTLLGSYVLICLIESGRPIDDDSFKRIKLRSMRSDEKNRFTENCLDKIIQTKSMYQFFLETFLNQPDDEVIKKVKKVTFVEVNEHGKYIYADENGKQYDNLPENNSSHTRYIFDDGEEYNPEDLESLRNLKRVPSTISPLKFSNSLSLNKENKFYYELDEDGFNKIQNAFSKLYPEIYKRVYSEIWNIAWGVKNHSARDLFEKSI
jgi:hypothetical protein